MEIKGITHREERSGMVDVTVGAGVTWDEFVAHTVRQGWWGIENMSLIPGTTGAIAVQNASAYGQESRQVIRRIRAYDTRENRFVDMAHEACEFRYRKSIFNTTEAGRYVIVSIVFRLNRNGTPRLSRHPLARELRRRHGRRGRLPWRTRTPAYSQSEIRDAVAHLRSCGRTLPVPDSAGNAGSFFQVRFVSVDQFWRVVGTLRRQAGWKAALTAMLCRWMMRSPEGIKLPPRLMIQSSGAASLASGGVSLYPRNCTVLIHSGASSSSQDILNVIRQVRTLVFRKTGVALPVEPSLVGFTEDELRSAFSLSPQQAGNPAPRLDARPASESVAIP
jgi:UDP-N-acetylmuramate dehydrogenase